MWWILGIGGGLLLSNSACHTFDDERRAGPNATLGDDMYGVMCDRLGASVLAEDLVGESFRAICHYDGNGVYGNEVDVSLLPPVSHEAAVRGRDRALQKMARMVTYRSRLIKAFNTSIPDIDIPDLTTDNQGDSVRLHDAVLRFTQGITPLYETNPYGGSEPVMPMMTEAFGRLFDILERDDAARGALMRIAGRQGYRAPGMGMGGVRSLLSYNRLRPLLKAQLEVLGPDGTAAPELQQLLLVAKRELLTVRPIYDTYGPLTVNSADASLSRPRNGLEFVTRLMFDENEAYAGFGTSPVRYVVRRDQRGFAIPVGSQPGVPGSVPAPFIDANNDGFADVDGLGQFVASQGPLAETPFVIPGTSTEPGDAFGRSNSGFFEYLDVSRTLMSSLLRDGAALFDGNVYAPDDDPQPWKKEFETVMYAMQGAFVTAGKRAPAVYDHINDAVLPEGSPCSDAELSPITGQPVGCTPYNRFVGETSPITELAHAAGQVLADPESDAVLLGVMDLAQNHQETLARMLQSMQRIREIVDKHDARAAEGLEQEASVPYEVPIWDEVAQVAGQMTQHPGLIAAVLESLADPVVVNTHTQAAGIQGPPAAHFGETLSAYLGMKDRYGYNRQDINGPALNLTDGGTSTFNPHNPIDPNAPRSGENRSLFERTLQLIADGDGAKACNKQGAKVFSKLGSFELLYPLGSGTYDECELFQFADLGAAFLNATLPSNHPKRTRLNIEDGVLDAILNLVGGFSSKDALIEGSSGITGMTLRPTPSALMRLIFFGAASDQYGNLPDHDATNVGSDTDKFVRNAIEPVAPRTCPLNGNGVPNCGPGGVDQVLRTRDRDTIFAWERLNFLGYLAPTAQVFADLACPTPGNCAVNDITGERYFMALTSILSKHWPGADHGNYCDSNVAKSDYRYCSGAGLNRYEPLLAEAMLTDIIPAMHEFAKAASQVSVTIRRGPRAGQTMSGSEVVERLAIILFDPQYAAGLGIKNRAGLTSTTWTDGTPQPQLTVFSLFADALHNMDVAFETSDLPDAWDRQSKWKRARSLVVDKLLAVEGEGPGARFKSTGTAPMLVTLLQTLREQLNTECPNRENGGACTWAREELANDVATKLSSPLFAATADLTDHIAANEGARRETEWLLNSLMSSEAGLDSVFGMLASSADLLWLLRADNDMAPILNAASVAVNPGNDSQGAGCAERTIQVLKAMSGDDYDRYHALDWLLPAVVTPIDGGAGLTPLEIFADAMADIHRVDANNPVPLDAEDYRFLLRTLKEFMISDTRGFRQLYYIVQNRAKPTPD